MTIIALMQRLSRDLVETNPTKFSADMRQSVLDAVNSVVQRYHDHAPHHSKIVPVSFYFRPMAKVTLEVVHGSEEFTGYTIVDAHHYCSLKIEGDEIINQITGDGMLLFPYTGVTGTMTATIWHDAVAFPPEYASLASDLIHAESSRILPQGVWTHAHHSSCPTMWKMESNAHGNVRSVLRLNALPISALRYTSTAVMAPPRITFAQSLDREVVVPIRAEHLESYFIPAVRAELVMTDMWRNSSLSAAVKLAGERAESAYHSLIPRHIATPNNQVGTAAGY